MTRRVAICQRSMGVMILLVLWAGQTSAGDDIWFEDRASAAGFDFRHVSGHAQRHLMPEIMGGGVALADVDGDGDLDVYLVQGGSLVSVNEKTKAPGNQLYLNRGNGRFELAPETHGAADTGYGGRVPRPRCRWRSRPGCRQLHELGHQRGAGLL